MLLNGVIVLRNLLVHCSEDDEINILCRQSAFRKRDTDTFELHSSTSASLKDKVFALFGKSRLPINYNMDLSGYHTLILACDEWAGGVLPLMSSFIAANDLRYKNVVCIVFGSGPLARRTAENLRIRVSLSGGTVANVICVPVGVFKNDDEDLLFHIRHKLAV